MATASSYRNQHGKIEKNNIPNALKALSPMPIMILFAVPDNFYATSVKKTRKDCGHCDVCQENRKSRNTDEVLNNVSEQIMNMLSDNQKHDMQELRTIKAPTQMINKAVKFLIAENIIITDKFSFWLGKN